MKTIDLARVRAGDALLEQARELFTGRIPRPIPLEEVDAMTTDNQRTYTPDEAAALLQITTQTVRKYIREGRLSAAKIGKTYRIDRAQLELFWRSVGGVNLFGDEDEGGGDE